MPDHHLECPRMQRRPRIFQDSFAASVRFLASLALGVDDLGVDYFPVLLPSLAPCGTAARSARLRDPLGISRRVYALDRSGVLLSNSAAPAMDRTLEIERPAR